MSEHRTGQPRLLLVESAQHGGTVLERALSERGWTVTRREHAHAVGAELHGCDVILLALDDDATDAFELLLWLSAQSQRPAVVLLTRRADARVLVPEVLDSLGVDHVAAWPARIEQIEDALAAARREHAQERTAS